MATTTYDVLRGEQMTAIEAITPTVRANHKFLRHRGETDFREWAEAEGNAALRRFDVVDLDDDLPVDTSNLDFEARDGRGEILVAYPNSFAYGPDALRDMRDTIVSDRYQILKAAGWHGYASISGTADATVYQDDSAPYREEFEAVTILVIPYRFRFYQALP